jgi:hypothetical protein
MMCLSSVLACAPFLEAQVQPGHEAYPHFDIGPYSIQLPEKYILLIRKGNLVGAVQLTQINLDSDGEGQSTYESYFQGDGSGSFKGANVVTRSGEIISKPVRSITHTLSWKPGQHKLWVGNWWFGCMTPTLIPMASHYSNKDQGFEFAPTSASEINEVDARIRICAGFVSILTTALQS